MLFSIIIPIHNIEQYILQCLESIEAQDFKDYEVILVINASTDNSANICVKWAKNKNNVKILKTDIPGVSHARNIGIQEAKGDWIVFADGDDYLKNNALKVLSEGTKKNSKYILANYDSGNDKTTGREGFISSKQYQLALLDRPKYFGEIKEYISYSPIVLDCVWGGSYNTKAIKDNNLRFDEDVAIGEDLIFNLNFSKYIDKIYCIDSSLFYYRVNDKSVSRSSGDAGVYKRLNYIKHLKEQEVLDYLIEAKNFKCVDILLHAVIGASKYLFAQKEAQQKIIETIQDPSISKMINKCRVNNLSKGKFRNNIYSILIKLIKNKKYKLAFLIANLYNKGMLITKHY